MAKGKEYSEEQKGKKRRIWKMQTDGRRQMLWITRDYKLPKATGAVVPLDPPLHGARLNDAPACEHGNRMAVIKRNHPANPGGLVLSYWSCKCVQPLAGAELFRCVREMRRALERRRHRQLQRPLPYGTPWGRDAARIPTTDR